MRFAVNYWQSRELPDLAHLTGHFTGSGWGYILGSRLSGVDDALQVARESDYANQEEREFPHAH